jgi:hypothetical protein
MIPSPSIFMAAALRLICKAPRFEKKYNDRYITAQPVPKRVAAQQRQLCNTSIRAPSTAASIAMLHRVMEQLF